MLTKKFVIARMSDTPVAEDHVYGHVLLGQDGECWQVGRSLFLVPMWQPRLKLAMPLRYLGADEMRPDFESVDAHHWQRLFCTDPRQAVIFHWGQDYADRYVTPCISD